MHFFVTIAIFIFQFIKFKKIKMRCSVLAILEVFAI